MHQPTSSVKRNPLSWSRCMILALAVAVTATLSAQQVVFVVNSSGALYRVDIGSCTRTLVGYTGLSLFDIAYCPNSGLLYGVAEGDGLYIISTTTGSASYIGPTGVGLNALACDVNGMLLGASEVNDHIYSVNSSTGWATSLGSTGVGSISGGDITFFNGELYWSTDANEIVLVNVTDPQSSMVVGTISGAFDVYGIVSLLNCEQEVYVSSGSNFLQLDMQTLQTTMQCFMVVPGEIYGAASVSETTSSPFVVPAGPFCDSDPPSVIGAQPAGGSWAASCSGCIHPVTGMFDPALAGEGVWTVTYTHCGLDLTQSIIVQSTTATTSPAGPFCVTSQPVALSASSSGGLWYGPGIVSETTGVFDPAIAGAGMHTITYTPAGPCGVPSFMTIEVQAPDTFSIDPAGPFCNDAAAVPLVSSAPGGLWSGPGIVDPTTGLFSPSAAGAGTHIITQWVPGMPCPATGTNSIVVEPIPNLIVEPFGPFCANTGQLPVPVVTADQAGQGEFTFASGWPNSITLLGNQQDIEYNFTSDNGCTSSLNIPFTIHDTTDVVFDSIHACIDAEPFDLQPFVDLPGGTFLARYAGVSWIQLPDLFDPAAVLPVPSAAEQVGIRYIYTNAQGCVSTNDTVLTVHPLPQVQFGAPDVCTYSPLAVNNTSTITSGTIATWAWAITGQPTLTSEQVGPFAYPVADTLSISLTATSDRGCANTVEEEVIIHPVPVASFTSADACQYETVPYLDQSTIAWNSGVDVIDTWDWRFGDGSYATGTEPTHAWQLWGTYTDTLIVTSAFGCADMATRSIVIHPAPVNSLVMARNCFGQSTTLTSTSTIPQGTIAATQWTMDTPTANYEGPVAVHTFSSAGFFPITLQTQSDQGCITILTDTLEIWPLPQVAFVPTDTVRCVNNPVTFTDTSTIPPPYMNSAWQWSINGAIAGAGSILTVAFDTAGSYSVGLIVTSGNGCQDSLSVADLITVHPLPIAGFYTDPARTGVLTPEIQVVDTAQIAVEWAYDLGDGHTSTDRQPVHTYATFGTYLIQQIVTSMHGCLDTAYQEVIIDPVLLIYVPNAFTPDGDGINDVFLPSLYGFTVRDYNLTIWNRWGELIFETNNQSEAWDGSHGGALVHDGVYIWQLEVLADDIVGRKVQRGHVTVLR